MRKYIGISLIILFTSLGCIELVESPFEPGIIERNLVVDGKILPGSGPFFVKLQQIADFARDSVLEVSDAEISLQDEEGNTYEYAYQGEGIYEIAQNTFIAEVGKSYSLQILWQNNSYRSQAEKIPQFVPIDKIYVEFSKEAVERIPPNPLPRDVIKIFLDTEIPSSPQGPYLRWEATEDFVLHEFLPPGSLKVPKSCYYNRTIGPQQIKLLDGDRVSSGRKEKNLIGIKELDWTFFYKHYFNVVQYSISAESFEYWERADLVINQVGSIFDIPPAGLQGNIFREDKPEELVLGYFEATATDTAHHVVFRADFPFGVQVDGLCPSLFYYQFIDPTLHPACCRCEIIEGARLTRPYYWED
ncbi:MAG: DUF4249 domain-containing protein [Bacteroidota bacterium]